MLAAVNPSAPEQIALQLQALGERVEMLAADNRRLHDRLAASEAARADLFAQAEHLMHMLDLARRELRQLKGEAAS